MPALDPVGRSRSGRAKLRETTVHHGSCIRGYGTGVRVVDSHQAVRSSSCRISQEPAVRNLVPPMLQPFRLAWDTDTGHVRLQTLAPLLTQDLGAGQRSLHCLSTCAYHPRPRPCSLIPWDLRFIGLRVRPGFRETSRGSQTQNFKTCLFHFLTVWAWVGYLTL